MSDFSSPAFWDARYTSGQTPWDFGGVPSALKEYLRAHPGNGARALIPGCGAGHEVTALATAGYEVTAIDLSSAAVARARANAGPELADRIITGDFFRHGFAPASFDLIYERTFLCAIPPAQRVAYRDRVAALLKPGGAYIGYFYHQKTEPNEGPPHGLAWGESDLLFGRHFLLLRDIPSPDGLAIFSGCERWHESRRTPQPVS
jgi:SAM-dependent methyltransferase